jgi:hypothetical protein
VSEWGLAAGLELNGRVLAWLEPDGPEPGWPVLAGCGVVDGLGLAAGEVDGLGLGGLGLAGGLEELLGLAGGLDGPRVAPGPLDGLEWGVGTGRGVALAHARERARVTLFRARFGPTRPVRAGAGLDGLTLGLAGDALAGLGLTAGDEPPGLGLASGDGLAGVGLASGDGLAGVGLAGVGLLGVWAAGVASAGVDDVQLAARCPWFEVPCAAAAPAPADSPLPGPPAPGWLPVVPPRVSGGPLRMALRSWLACDHIWCPNGVTAETLIAMMSVIAATTAARRAGPSRGRRDGAP